MGFAQTTAHNKIHLLWNRQESRFLTMVQYLISCPVDYPDSCRGGFTNNICQKRTISQTDPGNCIMGDLSDMISYRFRLHHNNKIESTVNSHQSSVNTQHSTLNTQHSTIMGVQPELISYLTNFIVVRAHIISNKKPPQMEVFY
jgi:hypothetical protein